jgi:quercetin dioxygenase-like cupin family protein
MFNVNMKTKSLQIKPYMLECDEGQRFESLGARVCVKANAEQTGGTFNLFEVVCPIGFATPLHIHYAEDVAVFILEGDLTFFWGEEKMKANTGSYFFQPKGTPHGFRVTGDASARILYMTFPAGLDQIVVEHGAQSKRVGLETIAALHRIEILGSLPN